MQFTATLIIIGILVCLGLAIWKFEALKRIAMFLAGGLLISIAIVMIGRIWIPKLSGWWVPIVELVIVVAVILREKYNN